MLRRGQERVKRFLPGGLGGGRAILILIVVVIIGWLLTGFYRVQPEQVGVVLRFGEFSRITQPGLNYHIPYPVESVLRPEVTRQFQIDIGFQQIGNNQRDIPEESLMLTGDENVIDLDASVLWRIDTTTEGIRNYLFNIRDPERSVQAVAESVLREVMAQTDLQPALTEARDEIEQQTRDLTQEILNSYGAGIIVEEVRLQNVQPPPPVIDAFSDVLRARQDQQRLRNAAEAYRNDIIPRARGQAEQIIQEAEAYREQVVAEATGNAERFLSILSSYQVAPSVTAQRFYLETIEEVLQNVDMTLIDDQGIGQGVVPYLPLNELRRNTGGSTASQSGPSSSMFSQGSGSAGGGQ
jgi:membrane protease subunit HflK